MTRTRLNEILHNGTEADLIEDGELFTVRLWGEA